MTARARGALYALPLVLIACDVVDDDHGSDAGESDVGLEDPVVGACGVAAPPSDFAYPAGPYGVGVGDTVEDLTLEDCDGNVVSLGGVLAHGELVLLNVGAGWCQPCIEETTTLNAHIFEPYCREGLRVVQVLFQDQNANPATKLFCREWREQYGLDFPVLVDPLFVTERYFDAVVTPLNLLINADGTIVYRSEGEVPGAVLDEEIASRLGTDGGIR